MAVAQTQIATPNKGTDNIYIDHTGIDDAKAKVKEDLSKIKTEITAMRKAYKTLKSNKNTKGTWKSVTDACVKQADAYGDNLETISSKLESCINGSVLQYVLTQIQALQAAQQAAQHITDNAGTVK